MTDDTDLRQWLSALHAENKAGAEASRREADELRFAAGEATLAAWGLGDYHFKRDYEARVLRRGSIELRVSFNRGDRTTSFAVRDLEWDDECLRDIWIKVVDIDTLAAVITEGGFVE